MVVSNTAASLGIASISGLHSLLSSTCPQKIHVDEEQEYEATQEQVDVEELVVPWAMRASCYLGPTVIAKDSP